MLTVSILALAVLSAQDPAVSAANPPAPRTEEQARLDVCLFTPAPSRDPSCQPLLEAEAALVPDEAFTAARPTSLGWADTACPTGQFSGAARTACRDEQRGLFRRAERAREALTQGAAGGVYAEAWNRPPPAGSGETPGLAFSRDERQPVGDNCERRSSVRRDEDTGDSSSSYSMNCMWSSGDPETDQAARDALDSVMDWD